MRLHARLHTTRRETQSVASSLDFLAIEGGDDVPQHEAPALVAPGPVHARQPGRRPIPRIQHQDALDSLLQLHRSEAQSTSHIFQLSAAHHLLHPRTEHLTFKAGDCRESSEVSPLLRLEVCSGSVGDATLTSGNRGPVRCFCLRR